MSRPKVYLSGPITGISYDEATGWREDVTRSLWPDIHTYSPMRGLEDKSDHTSLAFYQDHPTQNQQAATARDRFDVQQCDLILVNLIGATDRVSIGTAGEIFWADAFGKFIVVAIDQDNNPHDHAMLRAMSGVWVHDLEEAVDIVRQILLPDPEPTPVYSQIPAAGDPFAAKAGYTGLGPAVAFPAPQDDDLVRVSGYVRRRPKAS